MKNELKTTACLEIISNTDDDILRWSNDNRFKLNSLMCKEFRIEGKIICTLLLLRLMVMPLKL